MNLRQALGPLYAPLSRAKHSQTARRLDATLWSPVQLAYVWTNHPYFAVDISARRGLGALLSEALLLCAYAESRGLKPCIASTNPLYTSERGVDFLATYFESARDEPDRRLRWMRYRTQLSFYFLPIPDQVSIPEADRLFGKYFAPRGSVLQAVESVRAGAPNGRFDSAVHFRGTDKVLEAPAVDYARFADVLSEQPRRGASIDSVLLATDDPGFERYIKDAFPNTVLTSFRLGAPANASRGRHFSDMAPADKALEALVNIFLIASAPRCIRTSSYLSAVSKIVNPSLETLTLNRTHWGSTHFPERQVLEQEGHDLIG